MPQLINTPLGLELLFGLQRKMLVSPSRQVLHLQFTFPPSALACVSGFKRWRSQSLHVGTHRIFLDRQRRAFVALRLCRARFAALWKRNTVWEVVNKHCVSIVWALKYLNWTNVCGRRDRSRFYIKFTYWCALFRAELNMFVGWNICEIELELKKSIEEVRCESSWDSRKQWRIVSETKRWASWRFCFDRNWLM